METIKNYLEAMFANMPNTEEVRKAKAELLQMMEDKYNELRNDGVSENNAVGTVIAEFGNLDDLAEDLGLTKEVDEVKEREQEDKRRFVSMGEVKAFLSFEVKSALAVAMGVMLCICSVIFPIISEFIGSEKFGMIGFFGCIAIAVGLFVYNGNLSSDWSYLKRESCMIDMGTAEYVKERKRNFKQTKALYLTIGVLLCAFCWLPIAITEYEHMAAVLFAMVGVGVFLIIYASSIDGSFERILRINDKSTISGTYGEDDEENVVYINKGAKAIMEVFWPTVLCIYLAVSFYTFDWGLTWIIWPLAGLIRRVLVILLTEEEE